MGGLWALVDRMCAVEGTVTTRITKLKLKELDIQIIKFAVRSSCGGALGNAQDTERELSTTMSKDWESNIGTHITAVQAGREEAVDAQSLYAGQLAVMVIAYPQTDASANLASLGGIVVQI